MALTAEEQRLVDWAKAQLPDWFSHGEREEEYLAASARIHGSVLALAQNWLGQTMILEAVGEVDGDVDWLDFHASERNTRRASGEADPPLRTRIRNVEDAIARPILIEAVQAIVDAEGIIGDAYLMELRRGRAHFGSYVSDTASDGGTFTDLGGGEFAFEPATKFQRPVLGFPESTHFQNPAIVISGSLSATNDGTYPVLGLVGDAVYFGNAGVAEVDPGATWTLRKRDVEGNIRDGFPRAFMGRGYRMGSRRLTQVWILPYGCTAATQASVLEMLRQKKGAGVPVIVECRTSP